MEERIEGHTRQWGLCGHLSVTDGKAVGPERTKRGQKGLQLPERACVCNEIGKTGIMQIQVRRKSVEWGERASGKSQS